MFRQRIQKTKPALQSFTAGAASWLTEKAAPLRRKKPAPPKRMNHWEKLENMTAAEWFIYHHTEVVGCPIIGKERKKTLTKWFGVPMWKSPLDLQIYQEIIFEKKPDVIVELGTKRGGSTLFLAHMLDQLGNGVVVGVDRTPLELVHPRIRVVTGQIETPEVVEQVKALCTGKVMVIHDADHSREAVVRDLRLYGPLVSEGQYFIVEDGIGDFLMERKLIDPPWDGGGVRGVKQFLKEDSSFRIDKKRERYLLTYNPSGYLLKRPRQTGA